MFDLRHYSLLILFLWTPPLHAFELDDSVISEQIEVSVKKYRSVMKEFIALEASVRSRPDFSGDPAVAAEVQDFVSMTVNPAEMAVRSLLKRYRMEYGDKGTRKLARKYLFADLIDQEGF